MSKYNRRNKNKSRERFNHKEKMSIVKMIAQRPSWSIFLASLFYLFGSIDKIGTLLSKSIWYREDMLSVSIFILVFLLIFSSLVFLIKDAVRLYKKRKCLNYIEITSSPKVKFIKPKKS